MRTRQGETICLGEWIRLASADFPPAGGVWGGMRAGFGLGVFGKKFSAIFLYANAIDQSHCLLNLTFRFGKDK